MKVEVYNINGEKTGKKVELPESVFGVEPNEHCMYLDVKRIQANKRQGTHSAKERNAIKGSTRKIKKQKGTGSARAGSIKNPLFKGGGRVFGPRPRSYDIKLNAKVRNLARCSALSQKAKGNFVLVIEDFNFEAPKTKQYAQLLNNMGLKGEKSLLVSETIDNNVLLSLRNIKEANALSQRELNTYDVMNATKLIFTESALEALGSSNKTGISN